MPLGYDSTLPPLSGQAHAVFPGWSGADGAYADNTAAALLLSRMQQDCAATTGEPQTKDCKKDLKLVLVSMTQAGYDDATPWKPLFERADHKVGGVGLQSAGVGLVSYNPVIFSDELRADWFKPMTDVYKGSKGLLGLGPGVRGTMWSGKLHTVTNPFYGVEGGYQVSVLLINTNFPSGLLFVTGLERGYLKDAAAYASQLILPASQAINEFLAA